MTHVCTLVCALSISISYLAQLTLADFKSQTRTFRKVFVPFLACLCMEVHIFALAFLCVILHLQESALDW